MTTELHFQLLYFIFTQTVNHSKNQILRTIIFEHKGVMRNRQSCVCHGGDNQEQQKTKRRRRTDTMLRLTGNVTVTTESPMNFVFHYGLESSQEQIPVIYVTSEDRKSLMMITTVDYLEKTAEEAINPWWPEKHADEDSDHPAMVHAIIAKSVEHLMTCKHENKAIYYSVSFDNKIEALKYIVEIVKNHKQKDHGDAASAEQRVPVSVFTECNHCH